MQGIVQEEVFGDCQQKKPTCSKPMNMAGFLLPDRSFKSIPRHQEMIPMRIDNP